MIRCIVLAALLGAAIPAEAGLFARRRCCQGTQVRIVIRAACPCECCPRRVHKDVAVVPVVPAKTPESRYECDGVRCRLVNP